METYFRQLASFFSLSSSLQEVLQFTCSIRQLRKGELLFPPDEQRSALFVLQTGILRCFILGGSGEEITDSFLFRYGDVFMGCAISPRGYPELCANAEAMAPTSLIVVDMDRLLPAISRTPELLTLACRLLSRSYQKQWEHKRILYHCSAEERYRWFLRNYPGLINHVVHSSVASFLGVTPVTLSRVRKKLEQQCASDDPWPQQSLSPSGR